MQRLNRRLLSGVQRFLKKCTLYDWTALTVLFVAVIPLFAYLAQPPVFIWDEAIYGLNALDVHETGDLIVMRRSGALTYYNTKPPFAIWMQALSISVFGANEFAIRFPSAMAALLTCVVLLVFSKKTMGDIRIGIVAVLVLISSLGFVRPHVTRTGDLDSMLVFWMTLYGCLALHFLFARPERYKLLFTCIGIGVAGAFYTKSSAGLLALPGLFAVALLYRKVRFVLTRRHTYIVAGITLCICALYYVVRELAIDGYLDRVLRSEYSRFYSNIMHWHAQPFHYYFENLVTLDLFTPYVYVLPVLIMAGLTDTKRRRQMLALLIFVTIFFLIISIPKVKLQWYDAPMYPFLALICGMGFISVYRWIETHWRVPKIVFIAVLAVLLFWPMRHIHSLNAKRAGPGSPLEVAGYAIRELAASDMDVLAFKVLMTAEQYAHYTQVEFYINAYNRHKGYYIELVMSPDAVDTGDLVLCCQTENLQILEERWVLQEVYSGDVGCRLVRLINRTDQQ